MRRLRGLGSYPFTKNSFIRSFTGREVERIVSTIFWTRQGGPLVVSAVRHTVAFNTSPEPVKYLAVNLGNERYPFTGERKKALYVLTGDIVVYRHP